MTEAVQQTGKYVFNTGLCTLHLSHDLHGRTVMKIGSSASNLHDTENRWPQFSHWRSVLLGISHGQFIHTFGILHLLVGICRRTDEHSPISGLASFFLQILGRSQKLLIPPTVGFVINLACGLTAHYRNQRLYRMSSSDFSLNFPVVSQLG